MTECANSFNITEFFQNDYPLINQGFQILIKKGDIQEVWPNLFLALKNNITPFTWLITIFTILAGVILGFLVVSCIKYGKQGRFKESRLLLAFYVTAILSMMVAIIYGAFNIIALHVGYKGILLTETYLEKYQTLTTP